MARTPVPKAAIDEHRDPNRPEHEIGSSSGRFDRGVVDAITKRQTPKVLAEGELGGCIALTHPSHSLRDAAVRRSSHHDHAERLASEAT